ncbi:MAG: hydroxysqualene dehydroxylase HpnE [Burkholderiaceae bacterium]
MRRTVSVIGAGWAGLAAAVEATRRGHEVTLFDMAAQTGGRSRGVDVAGMALDNGQHILIGAYAQTLALMRTVGVDIDQTMLRTPLRITYPEGSGLQLEAGAPLFAFARAVLRLRAWHWPDRLALLAAAGSWALRGFRCDPALTVAQLTRRLPASVRHELIDPLCVAALNTPSSDASAAVFLRVLKDALFSGPGSADLLLPRASLSALLPTPAVRWLEAAGARTVLSQRVNRLAAQGDGWSLDDQVFDRVVLATSAVEAARLTQGFAPAWASTAAALRYEPIVTVYLRSEGARLPEPMLALRADADAPAQFVFDRGQLGGPPGLMAFVISGAQAWVEAGQPATLRATLNQARAVLGAYLPNPLEPVQVLSEKRATFRCTPGLQRSKMQIAPGLHAAGDHVVGPYPATLEGAVRSGIDAVRALG